MSRDRLPPIPEAEWTPQQREHAREIIEGPRGALISPFVPLLRSPELMTHAQRMGEYLRYRSAIADGRRPAAMADDEALVHDFCIELHRNRGVSDATWSAAVARFGEQGAVDLLGINGYYTLLSMVMNGARTAVPPSSAPRLPDLPQ